MGLQTLGLGGVDQVGADCGCVVREEKRNNARGAKNIPFSRALTLQLVKVILMRWLGASSWPKVLPLTGAATAAIVSLNEQVAHARKSTGSIYSAACSFSSSSRDASYAATMAPSGHQLENDIRVYALARLCISVLNSTFGLYYVDMFLNVHLLNNKWFYVGQVIVTPDNFPVRPLNLFDMLRLFTGCGTPSTTLCLAGCK